MLDIEKYNFKFVDKDHNIETYIKEMDSTTTLELTVNIDMYTLEYKSKKPESKMYIFNRYIVHTQEQLDYLMYSGR